MDKAELYSMLQKEEEFDYEKYLNTEQLLSCQKDFLNLCNHDELQFQIVHQVEELWLKLMVHTLISVDECIEQHKTNKIITLFKRVHLLQKLMISQLDVLETMSPKDYQSIREQLGNGSGKESPGFRALSKLPELLWKSFQEHYLDKQGLTVECIYDSDYQHDGAYMVAEAMAEFDELAQKFYYHHLQLIYRSIGFDSKSLKGRSVEMLNNHTKRKFFPALWEVRTQMTDEWGAQYGVIREAID